MREAEAAFKKVLDARALRYGPEVTQASAAAEVGTYVGCRAGDAIFGIPVGLVTGLAPLPRFTPLSGMRFVRGLTHLRGDVMALVDVFEAVTGRPTRLGHWMLVLQGRGGRAAVPVEEFLSTRVVRETDLLPAERAPEMMKGVSSATSDLWLLLEAAAVRGCIDGAPPVSEPRRS